MQTSHIKQCFCRTHHQGNEGTLLYIHGLGESGRCFEKLIQSPQLSEWDHVAIDLPGYGKSLWRDTPLTLREHAGVVHEIIKTLSLPAPIIVVGHSMGGVIGQMLVSYCQDIDGFINVEGNLTIEDCQFSSRASVYAHSEFLSKGFEELRASIFDLAYSSPAYREYFVSLSSCDPRSFYANSQELIDLSARETLIGLMDKSTIPTTYFAGIPNGISERSLNLLKQARIDVVKVSLSGHWPFLDNAPLFIHHLKRFLNGMHKVA